MHNKPGTNIESKQILILSLIFFFSIIFISSCVQYHEHTFCEKAVNEVESIKGHIADYYSRPEHFNSPLPSLDELGYKNPQGFTANIFGSLDKEIIIIVRSPNNRCEKGIYIYAWLGNEGPDTSCWLPTTKNDKER